jgi:hypothetical protein
MEIKMYLCCRFFFCSTKVSKDIHISTNYIYTLLDWIIFDKQIVLEQLHWITYMDWIMYMILQFKYSITTSVRPIKELTLLTISILPLSSANCDLYPSGSVLNPKRLSLRLLLLSQHWIRFLCYCNTLPHYSRSTAVWYTAVPLLNVQGILEM